jgi:hypothetical protein
MTRNVQGICAILGAEGCYELALFGICEKRGSRPVDVVRAHESALAAKLVAKDCFVNAPAKLLEAILGTAFVVLKAGDGKDSAGNAYDLPLAYVCAPNESEILRFERIEGRSTIAHFVIGDGRGGVDEDPYEDSKTVRLGRLVSKRIIRPKGGS